MLSYLVECASMHVVQLLFDVLDDGRLLIEGPTRNDERLRTSKLGDNTSKLTGRSFEDG